MYNDYIVFLHSSYRKFKDKEKDTSVFFHFLSILALKYIHDTKDKHFTLKSDSTLAVTLSDLFRNPAEKADTGLLDNIIKRLLKCHPTTLYGILENISFRQLIIQYPALEHKLATVLKDASELSFGKPTTDYKESLGASVEYLIEKFVEENFHKQGFLYTPRSISSLMASLAGLNEQMSVYDPAAGLGTLLVQCAKACHMPDHKLHGQEINQQYWQLCKFNLLFNDLVKAEIELGDSLHHSRFVSGNKELKFDRIISHPPFDMDELIPKEPLDSFGDEQPLKPELFLWEEPSVIYKRKSSNKSIGTAEPKENDYFSHILSSMKEKGKAVVIVPHGVLFKLGNASSVRKQLVDRNLVEAVIDLPANVFYSSKVNVAILILNKNKANRDILFVDASDSFEPDRRRNKLRSEHRNKIVQAYQTGVPVKDYSYKATPAEVEGSEGDYNLTAKRYVKQNEKPAIIDLQMHKVTISLLSDQLKDIQKDLQSEMDFFSNNY